MFGDIRKKLDTVIKGIGLLSDNDAVLQAKITSYEKEKDDLRHKFNQLETEIHKIKLEVDAKLIEFSKEITDKYFTTLQEIFRYGREISLVDTLASNLKSEDFNRLKSVLLKPFLEERWKKSQDEKAQAIEETIKTKGEQILALKEDLHQRYLKLDREGKDTTQLKAKIELLDEILEGKNEKKNT